VLLVPLASESILEVLSEVAEPLPELLLLPLLESWG
jgi:hypothetical protein